MRDDEHTFSLLVLDVVRQIPKGEVMTYKEVAEEAGSPGAARAAGNILSNNYDDEIPCHRVILSSGSLGEYNRGRNRKRELLRAEGVLNNNKQ